MDSKRFIDLFGDIKLSASVKGVFKNSVVDDIRVNKEEKLMRVYISDNKILEENAIPILKKNLKENFPFINNVEVYIEYKLEDDSIEYKVKKYWGNILNSIKESSIVCFSLIKEANWKIKNENCLEISVGHRGAFLCKANLIDRQISEKIKERFNDELRVNFINTVESDSQKREREEELNNAMAEAAENAKNRGNIKSGETFSGEKNAASEKEKPQKFKKRTKNVKYSEIEETAEIIKNAIEEEKTVTVKGKILECEIKETKKGKLLIMADITDMTDSVSFKFFVEPDEFTDEFKDSIKAGKYVKVQGRVIYDEFAHELSIMAEKVHSAKPPKIRAEDNSEEKRVELHLHTKMSAMDAVTDVKDYINRAIAWGHKAIGITDHGVVQAFPDAMKALGEAKKAAKKKEQEIELKILYGVEAYLVDDLKEIVTRSKGQGFDDEYVVFDIETTGLDKDKNKIIEIGAVKVKNGEIADNFSEFVNPEEHISEKITDLTGITDEMVKDAPNESVILPKFFDFFEGCILVAHNADFDTGFIKKWAERNGRKFESTYVDTLGIARALFTELKKFTLDRVAKRLDVSLDNHHRAVCDAQATAEIFIKCIPLLRENGVNNLDELNIFAGRNIDAKSLKYYHAVIYAKNYEGLRNLYELISIAHLKYYHKRPRIPKSEYLKFKEGLIIGTACEAGEFFKAVLENADEERIDALAHFYDYFEIQPIGNNKYLIASDKAENVNNDDDLREINRKIVELGEKYDKPVVATCDAHFLEPWDEYYRRVIMAAQGFEDADNQPPLFYRTTEEMLAEFDYLGEEKAKEVVITNTNLIADMIEDILPVPDGTFPPRIEGADDELKKITMEKAISIYGDPLPEIVATRLKRELDSIIGNGYAVLYIIAQKLVWNSNDHGYIVGSRGSVGSSFAATMAGITEVNPLAPHYVCPKCKYSDFDSPEVKANAGNSGCDLPDKMCPVCGEKLKKDGHDIPFETFLGFNGDKEPDIDLNFSGEYQQQAHKYCETLFGEGNVFKAGTIGTLAEKTAFGFAKKYLEERNIPARKAEITRLKNGCVGIKRTTGQHPGGLMVVPDYTSIYKFCPIQHPADKTDSDIITTHFDYHSISGRLLKLDMLGHDVPTIIRMFKDMTGFDPLDVPLDDEATMSLFTSPKALGVTEEDINCKTGTFGVPEFGTSFTRQMLMDTKPATFSELVRISGLSHGTDVWTGNAQELIRAGIATLKEVIPTRDDIMVYLIIKGVENKLAFTIMESVRKGKGLTEEFEAAMREKNVPEWYIDSCKKIKYMFPKGHAVAYVTNSFRIGYFKVHFPYAFYAATFSVRIDNFDYGKMCFGRDVLKAEMNAIEQKGNDITTKEKDLYTTMELVNEMYARGFKFVKIDLYRSHANKFQITDDGLLPPLSSFQGLGGNAADNIVEAREDGEFRTIEDFKDRTKVSKTVIELMKEAGVFEGLPETNQLSLFDLGLA